MNSGFVYSQPDQYRFSLDSIQAVQAIVKDLGEAERSPGGSVLDICAGCGVMGIELCAQLPGIATIDFVEIQPVFFSHLEKNRRDLLPSETQGRLLSMNYEDLDRTEYQGKYDLVVCNPPYFLPTQGKLPPEEVRRRARFYFDSSPQKLFEVIAHVMGAQGRAYVLWRPLNDHKESQSPWLWGPRSSHLRSEVIADIRGTHLVRLSR